MRRNVAIAARKQPRQDRSRQMRDDILTAAVRVLQRDGAARFTTSRVAEAAGISVGSLYQYFPNKQALVFALHSQTVAAAWTEVQRILDHAGLTPRAKIRRIARMFFDAESREHREMGAQLADAESAFAEQPEVRALNEQVRQRFVRFVRDALPRGTRRARVELGADVLMTVLESVGKSVSVRPLSRRALARWATTCADMVADTLGLD
jgi:AcrR family transcriptional regulator